MIYIYIYIYIIHICVFLCTRVYIWLLLSCWFSFFHFNSWAIRNPDSAQIFSRSKEDVLRIAEYFNIQVF